jgi:multidrug resistance protein MdtO
MATIARNLPQSSSPLTWGYTFLKEELAPYPGRVALVARMTIAATLVMIVCMAFHVPFAFQGAIYALMISRESSRATLQSAAALFVVTLVSAGYLLLSISFVINSSLLHVLWVTGSFFLVFHAISTLTNYTASVALAIVLAVGIPLWDRHVPAETSVEDTLWLCWSVVIGVAITAGLELVFTRLRSGDEIVFPISERLTAVQKLFSCYAQGSTVDPGVEKNVIRLGTLGTSSLRRTLRRSGSSPQYAAEIGGVAVLVGRLIDLAATLTQLSPEVPVSDQRRFQNLASTVAIIRDDLVNRRIPGQVQFDNDQEPARVVPLLGEMERIVSLIPQAFADSQSIEAALPSADDTQQRLLVPDAFVNSEHLQFALKGCLAATSCYLIYNAIAWPGISTAVTTCLLTALTTIGSSRQKQVLRIAGAIVGGFLIGMGSQIFVLPYVDSITGFTVLFVAVTVFCSWFMTSSPRLSYFGIQVAVAFYLINLSEFKMQTSLAVARDRVVGIFLGLFVMWLVFDQLWSAPAAVQMKKAFISNLRLVAQYAREPVSKDLKTATARGFALRETINTNLDKVRALADGVLFEFGASREQDLALRDRIRRWQPSLRMLFILQIAARKYRLELPGFELPEAVAIKQRQFDDDLAQALDATADRLSGRLPGELPTLAKRFLSLERSVQTYSAAAPEDTFRSRFHALLALYRRVESVATSLQQEMQSAPAPWGLGRESPSL